MARAAQDPVPGDVVPTAPEAPAPVPAPAEKAAQSLAEVKAKMADRIADAEAKLELASNTHTKNAEADAPVCTVRFNGRLWSVVVDGVQVTTASTWTKGAAYVRHHYGVELSPPAEETDRA